METETPTRRGYQLPTRVDDDMRAALEKVAREDRRKVGPMVVILLEEALKARGEWPIQEK